MKAALTAIAVTLLACGSSADSDNDDVVGPFTGVTHRYVVDSFGLPRNNAEARDLAGDLDGSEYAQNLVGQTIALLRTYYDITDHGADMVASGAISSSVEIVADDLTDDDTVSFRYLGADGAPTTIAGGTFVAGEFRSNRARTTSVPGAAELHLPVFRDADPSVLPLDGMEVDMSPDGAGGYTATIRGGINYTVARRVAGEGLAQMIQAAPASHLIMLDMFDKSPKDYRVTPQEVSANSLLQAFLSSDLQGDAHLISFAFSVHLRPCDAGGCPAATFDHCFDRVHDGDESDVDCGGSCRACIGGAACTAPSDCDTHACNGTCAQPTCSDGLRDGLETDVDCGTNCEPCASDMKCAIDTDCASGQCGAAPSCSPDDLFCIDLPAYATCL
jgi:hypothetical protein